LVLNTDGIGFEDTVNTVIDVIRAAETGEVAATHP